MIDVVAVIADLAIIVFVVTSMLDMGLSLTVGQIVDPLRNRRLVALALAANFVLVPLAALLIRALIPLREGHAIGLLLLATAAGAPFLPKLTQIAKGNIALSVGLMGLLMVVTVIFVPLVLPLLLPGVSVNPVDIARSLVVLMLIPLGIGLLVRARNPGPAGRLRPVFTKLSSAALLVLFVAMLFVHWRKILSAFGSSAIVAALLFVAASLAVGYLLAGRAAGARTVMTLGTTQRNISAALLVAGQNFADPDVIVMVLTADLLMLSVLISLAAVLGRRQRGDRNEQPRIG